MSGKVLAAPQTAWINLPPDMQDLITFRVVHHAPRIMHHSRRMNNGALYGGSSPLEDVEPGTL